MTFEGDNVKLTPEELLQISFDAIQDGISILDTNLTILRVNRVMEQWYSHALPLVGKKCFEAYHLNNSACPVCPTKKTIKSGEPAVEEVPLIQESGQTGWLELFTYPVKDKDNRVIAVVEFVRDVTERKEAEKALCERERLYRTTLYSIGDAVIAADQTGRVNYMNPVAEDLTGWLEADARNKPLSEVFKIIDGNTRLPVDNIVAKIISKGLVVSLEKATTLINKEGFEIPIADSGAPIKTEDGKTTGIVIVFRDMTEDLRQQREIEEREQRAIRQRSAVASLSLNPVIGQGNLNEAAKVFIETASLAVQVERTSIWLLSEDNVEFYCIGLYKAGSKKNSQECLLESKKYPRYFAALNSESSICANDVCSDPRTSELAEDYYMPLGITSVLDAGIFFEGNLVGVISFEHVGETRNWHPDDESFASTVASLFGQVIFQAKRREAEDALNYQFQFEKMVAAISSSFVGSAAEKIDQVIFQALELSGRFFDADRSYIFRFSENGLHMNNTHEWCSEGISSQKLRNQDYPVMKTPWSTDKIMKNEVVHVPNVDGMPDELAQDKTKFLTEDIKSLLNIPMRDDKRVFGYFGFDTVRGNKIWTEQQIALLKVLTEMIAGAIIKLDAEVALKESEERYREILSTIEEAYYETDLAGYITFANEAGLNMFGEYSIEEAIGTKYHKLYKNPDEAYKVYHRVFLTGMPERGLTLEMIRKDGSIFYGEISITLIRDKEGSITGFKGIGRDVTRRIEYEKRLEYLSLHDQLTDIFNRSYFEAELERLSNSREYPITIISADVDGLKLINDTMGHEAGDRLLKSCASIIKKSLRKSDILARVGGDEFSAILPNTDKVTGEEIVSRIRKTIDQYNRKHVDLPLGISLGVASLDQAEIPLKDLFKRADDLMYRDKLYRSSSSRSKIVKGLLAALAERDYITEGHARRLEKLCRTVGENINLSSHQLADLTLLAQVHDLGKVGVPDHVLFKPEKLSQEEWETIHGHPYKGYRIASSSPDLAGVAELILKHHEKWDGSGYPMGLKETEIPIECRILAIVDAYDAMTNKRPYNVLKTVDEAVKELEANAGSQFDPQLVPVFIAVLKEQK